MRVSWTKFAHQEKRWLCGSCFFCCRPRRDLTPCYRRERITPLSKCNDLQEAGGPLSPWWSVQARSLPYRNPYSDFTIIHTALRLPPVKVALTYAGPIVSTSSREQKVLPPPAAVQLLDKAPACC